MHIKSIQIAIKPLIRLGLDIPILMCLRDARHIDFSNSLLAMAETNLANRPVYFNYIPGYLICLYDYNILDTLTLTVKTKNLNFKENVRAIVVIYKIYYKVMSITVNLKNKKPFKRDETLLFKANKLHSLILI